MWIIRFKWYTLVLLMLYLMLLTQLKVRVCIIGIYSGVIYSKYYDDRLVFISVRIFTLCGIWIGRQV